jgi:adenylosuccinate synthase
MEAGFVALAFGFCASVIQDEGQNVVALGYVSETTCVVRMEVGDSHGDTVTINDHDIGVEMIDGGAVVHIDDLLFVIPKTVGV